jgi:hypothetical protein
MPLDSIVERAAREASLLQDAGFHAVILENFGDVPFFPTSVPPIVVACMTACGREVRRAVRIPVGVNVLRNDPRAALAVAVASNADFVRINVHCGARLTDQGYIQGEAHLTVRERHALGAARVALYCDVDVKHAAPVAPRDIADEAEELVERALADVVLVTGAGTGKTVCFDDLRKVKARVRAPVLAASGVTTENLAETLAACDGAIIGSALRRDGTAGADMDPERVRKIAAAFEASTRRT